MKTVALVDPAWGGHHPAYLRFFSEALLQLGCRVVALCPEPDRLTALLASQPESGTWSAVRYDAPNPLPSQASHWHRRSEAFRRLEELANRLEATEQALRAPIDLVFFCFMDDFLGTWQSAAGFADRLGRPFSGLYFHPRYLRRSVSHMWLRRGFLSPDAVLSSSRCRGVAVLDEGVADALSRRIGDKPVIVFPDPTNVSASDQPTPLELQISEKAQGRKVVGLIGALEHRKGLMDLIQHATALNDQPLFFVAAGQYYPSTFSEEDRRVIERLTSDTPQNWLFFPNQVEDGTPFNGLIRRCDLLYAIYRDFPHSSNLLTKSAALRVPIVVSERDLMGERTRRYHLGFAMREDVPEDFRALVTSDQPLTWRQEPRFITGCAEYLAQHEPGRLMYCFQRILPD